MDLAGETQFKFSFDADDQESSVTTSPAIGTQGDPSDWRDVVAVSDDGGGSWTILDLLSGDGTRSYDVAAFASTHGLALVDNFMVMIQQHHSTSSLQGWAFDNIVAERETLTVSTLQPDTVEGTATPPSFTIMRDPTADLSAELIVTLDSSDPSEATVPSAVTITANQMSIDVPLTVQDDLEIDGPQSVRITASVDGSVSKSVDFVVSDNEPATLSVSFDTLSVSEAAGTIDGIATVFRNRDLDTSLEVNLFSSDSSAFTVQETVTIPAGETSVSFSVTTHNDYLVDATQTANLSATAVGFASGVNSLQVENDDTINDRTIGGNFSGNLPKDDYTVTFDVVVPVGQAWNIEAGSKLLFNDQTELRILGSILAIGTIGDPIAFDSTLPSPVPGSWKGINFDAANQVLSEFDHVEVAHAVTGFDLDSVNSPHVTIKNAKVHHHSGNGIQAFARYRFIEDVSVSNSKIHDNGANGISLSSVGTSGLPARVNGAYQGNEIYRNVESGIRVSSSYGGQGGVARTSSANPVVEGNHIYENATGISLRTSEAATPLGASTGGNYFNNLIIENDIGITVSRSGNSSIFVKIINNTIVESTGPAISHGVHGVSGMTIRNNSLANNGSGIVAESPFVPAAGQVGFNNVFASDDSNWTNYPIDFGSASSTSPIGYPSDAEFNTSFDPQFKAGSLFEVDPTSPTIDAGTTTGAPTDDYLDETRHAPFDIGAYEAQLPPAVVEDIVVNDGALQRSRVNSLTVQFNRIVQLPEAIDSAFEVQNLTTGQAVVASAVAQNVTGKTSVTLTFLAGVSVDTNGGLLEGNYELRINASFVSAGGEALDGDSDGNAGDDLVFGDNPADRFFRLFGDSDGDRDVDGQDYGRFGLAFLTSLGDGGFNSAFDFDDDGDVDGQDYGHFGLNFLRSL